MLTALIGLATTIVMGGLKKINIIDSASPIVKQLVVLAVAAAANYVRIWLGYDVPADMQGWIVSTILSALASLGFYNLYESNVKQRAARQQ